MKSSHKIFGDIHDVPDRDIALVLGTAKYAVGGENLFYRYRLDAAAELFLQGKVKGIIVSGDNSLRCYDEPNNMKKDLITNEPCKIVT